MTLEKLKRIPHNYWAILSYITLLCGIISLCVDLDRVAVLYFALAVFCAIEHDYFNLKKRVKALEEKNDGKD